MAGDMHIGLYVGKKVRIGKATVNGRTKKKGKTEYDDINLLVFLC